MIRPLSETTAIIIRSDLSDCAYLFYEPDELITGSWENWDILETFLKKHADANSHSPHPSGALVGHFNYNGSFEFHSYSKFEIESLTSLAREVQLFQNQNNFEEVTDQSTYEKMILQAKEYISAGDIYQINLARKFIKKEKFFNPHLFFQILWNITQAPQSAFLKFPDRTIISASPEAFIQIKNGIISTQPIKGTRPRSLDPRKDRANLDELTSDSKERAELIMITDLERNDLGQVCEFGSVHVQELAQAKTFSHVHHLVSTIEGKLRPEISAVQAIRACYPGGSITGAPKKRSIEIINKLEQQSRDYYTGAIGYLGFDGTARFNIAIRTCCYENNKLSFWAGSGITTDSNPTQEFEETIHKAAAIENAYAIYSSMQPKEHSS
jgi:para-aminobenzoate synthetase component 1